MNAYRATFRADDLKRAIRAVTPFVYDWTELETVPHTLSHVYMEGPCEGGVLSMVGCDGVHMARAWVDAAATSEWQEPFRFMAKPAHLEETAKALPRGKASVTVDAECIDGDRWPEPPLRFTLPCGHTQAVYPWAPASGAYPVWRSALPEGPAAYEFTITGEALYRKCVDVIASRKLPETPDRKWYITARYGDEDADYIVFDPKRLWTYARMHRNRNVRVSLHKFRQALVDYRAATALCAHPVGKRQFYFLLGMHYEMQPRHIAEQWDVRQYNVPCNVH